ncbi:hypothetical protein [Salinibacter ruber]|uniref:Lipoprotein n=1 Tax=Salinibacter ruber TaxID=146919 RepID=A0A9X2V5N9_9BACT|nr:hypothetical protein [Salinibacter ruber]MCS4121456.1 hypothetical protein [Salinibacter ruber]
MRSSWLPALLVGGALLVSLTACSDSSDVGLGVGSGLGDEEFSTIDVTPTVRDTTVVPITGDNQQQRPSRNEWRFLIGEVNDPIEGTGTVTTEGYVDFAGLDDLPAAIDTADAEDLTAELRLTTSYFHGYSTESMEVKVYDLTEEADMDSARATADILSEDEVESSPASVVSSQIDLSESEDSTTVTIELRAGWIADHPSVLNPGNDGSNFEENFHGFRIEAPDSRAVVGFSSSAAALRLRTVSSSNDTTTADYSGLKTFTHIERTGAGDGRTSGHRLIQGGVGKGLAMEWNFRTDPLDSLRSTPLYGAKIFVPNNASTVETPSNFERPRPQGYSIIATRPEDEPLSEEFRGTGIFAISGRDYALPVALSDASTGAFVGDNVSLPIFLQSLQRVRNGRPPVFTTFGVSISGRASTSPPTTLPVLVPVDGTNPLRATLTTSRPK